MRGGGDCLHVAKDASAAERPSIQAPGAAVWYARGIIPSSAMPPVARQRQFDFIAETCLAGAVLFFPFALGGAAVWALWPLVTLALVACLAAGLSARVNGERLVLAPLAGVLLAVSALLVVQLL